MHITFFLAIRAISLVLRLIDAIGGHLLQMVDILLTETDKVNVRGGSICPLRENPMGFDGTDHTEARSCFRENHKILIAREESTLNLWEGCFKGEIA